MNPPLQYSSDPTAHNNLHPWWTASTALCFQQTRSSPRPPTSELHHNSYRGAVDLVKVTAEPLPPEGQWPNTHKNMIWWRIWQLVLFFLRSYICSCRCIVVRSVHMELNCFSFVVVLSNPRHFWTQLSRAHSASGETDYEQYEASSEPPAPLSTFRSELLSSDSFCVHPRVFLMFLVFAAVEMFSASLHLAVASALRVCVYVCVCVWSLEISVCTACLKDGLWLNRVHPLVSRLSEEQSRAFDEAFRSQQPLGGTWVTERQKHFSNTVILCIYCAFLIYIYIYIYIYICIEEVVNVKYQLFISQLLNPQRRWWEPLQAVTRRRLTMPECQRPRWTHWTPPAPPPGTRTTATSRSSQVTTLILPFH